MSRRNPLRSSRLWLLLLVLFAVGIVLSVLGPWPILLPWLRPGHSVGERSTRTVDVSAQGLHILGNQLVTKNGTPVVLHGISRDGSDFLCAEGHGIFDGPTDPAYTQTMLRWHINSIRLPLNEGCWLGVGSVPASYGGVAYRQAIINYVDTLTRQGIYVILDLHKLAFGTRADTHNFRDMPDATYAIPFWQQVAEQFKSNTMVLFELFNEPHGITWSCWRNGGHCTNVSYRAAGMQTLVNVVRQTQATNVIVLPGLRYGNDLNGWLPAMPNDPQHNLAASWHDYTASDSCATPACYDRELLPIVRQVPLINTEFGTDAHGIICGTQGIGPMLSWSDAHHASYLAWTWNVGSQTCGGLSLISDWKGTPKAPNGTFFHDWLLTHG